MELLRCSLEQCPPAGTHQVRRTVLDRQFPGTAIRIRTEMAQVIY